MNVAYSDSPAFSPKHYRLVQAVESASDDETRLAVLVDHLQSTRSRFKSKATWTASTKHDLLLALYSRSQRPQRLPVELEELFSLEWCLPRAIKLAGGSETELSARATGYRICDEVFSEQPHVLKLLLINTIRADLECESGSRNHLVRWTLGLRAAASPRLATADLCPAVSDRILHLFKTHPSPSLRRLALAALVNFYQREWCSTRVTEGVRRTIEAYLGFPSANKDAEVVTNKGERDPGSLAALIRAYPAFSKGSPRQAEMALKAHMKILQRVTHGEWAIHARQRQGVDCPWLSTAVLSGMTHFTSDVHDEATLLECANTILHFSKTVLDKGEMGQALLFDGSVALGSMPLTVAQKLSQLSEPDLRLVLNFVAQKLDSTMPNERLWALKSLCALQKELWFDRTEADGWGEPVWRMLMRALSDTDGSIRKQCIKLLNKVDATLVTTHIDNLLNKLRDLRNSGKEDVRARLIDLVLETVTTHDAEDGSAFAKSLASIVEAVRYDKHTIVDQVVLNVVDRLGWWDSRHLEQFASAIAAQDWKEDLTLASVFATVAGQGGGDQSEMTIRHQAVSEMLEWMQRAPDQSLLEALQEPFVLSILRILSQGQDFDTTTLLDGVRAAAAKSTTASRPIFELLQQCLQDGSPAQRALQAVGRQHKAVTTLPAFLSSLKTALTNPVEDDFSDETTSSQDSRMSMDSSDKPLRYDPYASPSSASTSLPRIGNAVSSEEERHRRLERELARERKIRGGGGGVGESVMLVNAGELALMHADDGDDDVDSDGSGPREGDEEGSTPTQGSVQQVLASGRPSLQARRDSSCSSRQSRPADNEPPQDLLTEMDELDPFKS
ncbi:hypothetical protein ACM66B_005218 [Microbotryomycetes sp. NB124-2]